MSGVLGQTAVATGTIANIDRLKPKEFTPKVTATTNSITVESNTTDQEKTSDDGCSGIAGYRFSKDNGVNWTDWQTSGSYTFSSLIQNTTYEIKIEVKDKAENTNQAKVIKVTENVPGIQTGSVVFSYNPSGDTNGDVKVKISGNNTGYILQYKTSKTGSSGEVKNWTNYSNEITLTRNQDIYARVVDSTGQFASTYATGTIANIDKIEPNAFTPSATSEPDSITVTANTTDKSKTDDYKCSGMAGYRFSKDNGNTWTAYQSSGKYIFTGLIPNTTYNIQVEAKDKAGNTIKGSASISTQKAIAKIGNKLYNSLSSAIGAVPSNNVETNIILLDNIQENNTVVANKNINLNLNGKTITGIDTGSESAAIEIYGKLIVYGGTITGRNACYLHQGTLNIEGGTMKGTYRGIDVNGGTLNINNNPIIQGSSFGINGGAYNLTINVNSGTIIGDTYEGISLAGNSNTININGGQIKGGSGIQIYEGASANITVTNGTITGNNGYGMVVYSGTTVIEGGTITGNVLDGILNNGNGIINVKGGSITGNNLGIFNNKTGTINMYGGTVRGSYYDGIKQETNGNIYIYGGTVSGKNWGIYSTQGMVYYRNANMHSDMGLSDNGRYAIYAKGYQNI